MSRKEKHIKLTDMEKFTLQQGAKHHSKAEFREKCRGLLLNQAGVTIKQVATHLSVNHNTVGNWIKAWENFGIAGLQRKIGQGRTPILKVTSPDHVKALAKAVDAEAKNVKLIQANLIEALNMPMSSDTVKRFLKKIIIPGGVSAVAPMRRKTS